MAEGKDIAWTPILITAGIGLALFAVGTFVTGPLWHKSQLKKATEKAKGGNQSTPKK